MPLNKTPFIPRTTLLLALFLVLGDVKGQLENRLWYFGPTQYGFQFSGTSNILSTTGGKYVPFGSEGCSVITDPVTGQLRFYTDGISLIDASHRVMPNGGGLKGHSSSAQNGLTCSVPGQCNQFYVFSNSTNTEGLPNGSIYYHIVDILLPGNGSISNPLGNVVPSAKNIFVTQGSEAAVLIPALPQNEYWLLSVQAASSIIRVFKVSGAGVFHFNDYSAGVVFNDARSIRFSQVSGKFVVTSMTESDPVCIGDFNTQTGVISNTSVIPGTPVATGGSYLGFYDAEWSSDGSKVYFSKYRYSPANTGGRLYQYDLNSPTTPLKIIYDVGGSFSNMGKGLKIGPDGKIYWLYVNPTTGDTRYLGIINNPNLAGALCDFNPFGYLVGQNLGNAHKFPDFLSHYNRKPIANDDHFPACISSQSILQVLNNDSDPDGNSLNLSIIEVSSGLASVQNGNEINYIPQIGYQGNVTIRYAVCDNNCFPLCDTAIVTLCYNCINAPPVAVNDTLSECEEYGFPVTINILGNDFDQENDVLQPSVYKTFSGNASFMQDNSLSYYSNADFEGIDSVHYIICDMSCDLKCDTATVYICVKKTPLIIPNLITLNQDSYNEDFYVSGIYPETRIEIYNRWGELLFSSDSYNNNWNGDGHPDGVYFVFLKNDRYNLNYKGWIHLLRK